MEGKAQQPHVFSYFMAHFCLGLRKGKETRGNSIDEWLCSGGGSKVLFCDPDLHPDCVVCVKNEGAGIVSARSCHSKKKDACGKGGFEVCDEVFLFPLPKSYLQENHCKEPSEQKLDARFLGMQDLIC
jgi:hypothetical protein